MGAAETNVRERANRSSLLPVRKFVLHTVAKLVSYSPVRMLDKVADQLSHYPNTLFSRRAKIIRINLRHCFRHLNESELEALTQDNIKHTLMGYLLTVKYWSAPLKSVQDTTEFSRIDIVQALRQSGTPVLLVGGHFSYMDIAGIGISSQFPVDVTFRPHNNPDIDSLINSGRRKWAHKLINVRDTRGMLRSLKNSGVLWYAPDQDMGSKNARFSRFFGIDTATTLGISRIARISNAVIVPMSLFKCPDNGRIYVEFGELINPEIHEDQQILDRYNQFLEQKIRRHPDQYLWAHRRFKTRPQGQASLYSGTHS